MIAWWHVIGQLRHTGNLFAAHQLSSSSFGLFPLSDLPGCWTPTQPDIVLFARIRLFTALSIDISRRHFLRLYTSGVALSKHPSLKLHHRCVSSLRTISSYLSTALKC